MKHRLSYDFVGVLRFEIAAIPICDLPTSRSRKPQKEVGKRRSITFFSFFFGTLSVTFWSLFLMLLSLFFVTFLPNSFCRTPFAGLLLRQGDSRSRKDLGRSGKSTFSLVSCVSWEAIATLDFQSILGRMACADGLRLGEASPSGAPHTFRREVY